MDKESVISFSRKKSPWALCWGFSIVMVFGLFTCLSSFNLVKVPPIKTKETPIAASVWPRPVRELIPAAVHFPRPKSYKREECAWNPVRNFAILSMQRSGSGWFETLLNSHPNISSNGEIFSVKPRKANFSTIKTTLDSIYNLDWISSAAKNSCAAATGFKWMLNQAVMDYHSDIANYFNSEGVSVIFIFRKNLLRRHLSVLANAYDKEAKLINGTHKSHVHSREEADLLAQYKPRLDVSVLIQDLAKAESMMKQSLVYFRATSHIVMYYEDLMKNSKLLSDAQEFLGLPVRKLVSHQVKIHTKSLYQQIENWSDVYRSLKGSVYEIFLGDHDYDSSF